MTGEDDAAFDDVAAMQHAERRAALEELVIACLDTHLSPVDATTHAKVVARLLDEAYADYTEDEVVEVIGQAVEHDSVKLDRLGRLVPRVAGRSTAQVVRAFARARGFADQVADYEAPANAEAHWPTQRLMHHQLLSAEDERRLGRLAGEGRRDSINELVVRNLRLVWSMTGGRRASAVFDCEDTFQEACFGLVRAAEKFDVTRGFKFSTYACPWIRQAATRGRADRGRAVRLPVHVDQRIQPVLNFRSRYAREHGAVPYVELVAKRIGRTVAEVESAIETSQPVLSIDDPRTRLPADPASSWQGAQRTAETAADVRWLIRTHLDARQRRVIAMRFGLDGWAQHTLDDVGKRLGVTRERVRQIQTDALKRLAELLERPVD